MDNTIRKILDNKLCVACGACFAVCPAGAIKLVKTSQGLLTPVINTETCTGCGLCKKICPGQQVKLDLSEQTDPFKGEVIAAYVAHAADENIRNKGQSGGAITALLSYMLDKGLISKALVTKMRTDGTLQPKPFFAENKDQLIESCGSKYCPVASNSIFNKTIDEDFAAVGTSCQFHGLSKLQTIRKDLADHCQLKIGLFCDRVLRFTAIDEMARRAKVDIKSVIKFEYRSKENAGWPGEVCFHLESGEKRFFDAELRTSIKDLFTQPRCRVCFDKMNVLADISVGDAWGISESSQGDSVIIARTQKGNDLLQQAREGSYLVLEDIDVNIIFKKQAVELRRKNFTGFTKAWQNQGLASPNFGIDGKYLTKEPPQTVLNSCQAKLELNLRLDTLADPTKLFRKIHRTYILKKNIKGLIKKILGRG